MLENVIVSKTNEGVVTITLNRPEAANSLSIKLLNELKQLLYDLKFDQNIRCIIITGAGEKIFCAGADLKERSKMNMVETRQTVALINEVIHSVETFPMPVIAAVNGMALGGGTELALACDIRVASENAKFGLTETSLGIIPGAGGTQQLPRLIGKGKAKELIFTAKKVSAAEAERIGLAEYVIPLSSLMEKANEIASQIVKNAPIALKQAKFAIDKGYDVDLTTGLAIERNAYEVTIPTKDRLEGLNAFKEKRLPIYKGE